MNNILFYKRGNIFYYRNKSEYPINFIFQNISLNQVHNILNFFSNLNIIFKIKEITKNSESKKYLVNLSIIDDKSKKLVKK